jgi:hypothetical protein
MTESKYSKYVVTELQFPKERSSINPVYARYANRILWMDENVVPGAFQVNASWYFKAGNTLEDAPHVHDADEMLGFFGSDPDNPHDLGGEIEIWLEDEKQVITKSVMLFIPAGMKHCPLVLKRVDRPIFHFGTIPGNKYSGK